MGPRGYRDRAADRERCDEGGVGMQRRAAGPGRHEDEILRTSYRRDGVPPRTRVDYYVRALADQGGDLPGRHVVRDEDDSASASGGGG